MIYWLTQTLADHPALTHAEAPDGLLNAAEIQRCRLLKVEKRRRDWLLGRWTAKQLVAHYVELTTSLRPMLSDILIAADPDGAPRVTFTTPALEAIELTLSISHSRDRACCAISTAPGQTVGIDLEYIEPRDPAFAREYFVDGEIKRVMEAPADRQALLITTIWSAKEAVLKALRRGLTVSTRSIVCLPDDGADLEWTPTRIWCDSRLTTNPIQGWWRILNGFAVGLAVIDSGAVRDAQPLMLQHAQLTMVRD